MAVYGITDATIHRVSNRQKVPVEQVEDIYKYIMFMMKEVMMDERMPSIYLAEIGTFEVTAGRLMEGIFAIETLLDNPDLESEERGRLEKKLHQYREVCKRRLIERFSRRKKIPAKYMQMIVELGVLDQLKKKNPKLNGNYKVFTTKKTAVRERKKVKNN